MSIETQLVNLLKEKGMTISTAESLTGGLATATLVKVPGASAVFKEGFITYETAAKVRTLGVSQDAIDKHGAVSAEVAEQMARGAAKNSSTEVAISTTGNAGPDTMEGKPVGLVYTAVYINGDVKVTEHHFSGDRPSIRLQTVNAVIMDCYNRLKAM